MADWAHDWTDVEIERLNSKIERQFLIAKAEMAVKMEDYLEDFERRRLEWLAKVEAGTETQEEYEAWLQRRYLDRAWYEDMIDMLTDAAVNADREAMAIIRDKIPEVFAENANYSAYSVEMGIGKNTHSFDLYDRDTVARLLVEDRRLLPPIPEPRLKELKDKIWNQQKFTSAVTQSILQGESIPNAAKRMMSVFDMDKNAAIRAARTSITGAESAGRVHSYQRAKDIGIDLEQEWLATLDLRTRHTHRLLDGTHVPVGGKFKTVNGTLQFPADPEGPPEEVYNCRCTLVPWFPWMDEDEMPDRWSNLPDGMTYEEWKSVQQAENRSLGADLLTVQEVHHEISKLAGINFLGKEVESSEENPSRLAKSPIRYVGQERTDEVMAEYKSAKENGAQHKLEEVSVSDLLTTQAGLYRENLHWILDSGLTEFESPTGGVDYIEVFELDGKLYIIDGNHRCAVEKLRHVKKIRVMLTKSV